MPILPIAQPRLGGYGASKTLLFLDADESTLELGHTVEKNWNCHAIMNTSYATFLPRITQPHLTSILKVKISHCGREPLTQ